MATTGARTRVVAASAHVWYDGQPALPVFETACFQALSKHTYTHMHVCDSNAVITGCPWIHTKR